MKTGFAAQITAVEATGKLELRFTRTARNVGFPFGVAEYDPMIVPEAGSDGIRLPGIGTGPINIASANTMAPPAAGMQPLLQVAALGHRHQQGGCFRRRRAGARLRRAVCRSRCSRARSWA